MRLGQETWGWGFRGRCRGNDWNRKKKSGAQSFRLHGVQRFVQAGSICLSKLICSLIKDAGFLKVFLTSYDCRTRHRFYDHWSWCYVLEVGADSSPRFNFQSQFFHVYVYISTRFTLYSDLCQYTPFSFIYGFITTITNVFERKEPVCLRKAYTSSNLMDCLCKITNNEVYQMTDTARLEDFQQREQLKWIAHMLRID